MSDHDTIPAPDTPPVVRRSDRLMIYVPSSLLTLIEEYKGRNVMRTRTEAILSLVRRGLKAEGLMGGNRQ